MKERIFCSMFVCLLFLVSIIFVGCSGSTPGKVVPPPNAFNSKVASMIQKAGDMSGTEGAVVGSGNGELAGKLVDPYEYVEEDDLGSGSFTIAFESENFTVEGQSLSAMVNDPEYGNYFVGYIGDFYSLETPFIVIQSEMSVLDTRGDSSEIVIDNYYTYVMLVDGTFENILGYATSGTITFDQLGSEIGDNVKLSFNGSFEKYDDVIDPVACEGTVTASFDVFVNDATLDIYPNIGTGSFSANIGESEYYGGNEAVAFLSEYYLGLGEEGDVSPGQVLDIVIGDCLYETCSSTGNILYITAYPSEDALDTLGFQAWAYLYDSEYNIIGYSDVASYIEAEFPGIGDTLNNSFSGHIVGENCGTTPCEAKKGDGRGTFDTWLNLNSDSWASYIGTGHVEVAFDDGTTIEVGDLARASAYSYYTGLCEDTDGDGSIEDEDCDVGGETFLTIEIGDLMMEEYGYALYMSLSFEQAISGEPVTIDGINVYASIYDLWSYQEVAHATEGTLQFNEIGSNDGDLVIGHFDAIFENNCDEPPPVEECDEYDVDASTDIEAAMNGDSVAVTVTVNSAMGMDLGVEVPAMAYVMNNLVYEDTDDSSYVSIVMDSDSSMLEEAGLGDIIPEGSFAEVYIGMTSDLFTEGTTQLFDASWESGVYASFWVSSDYFTYVGYLEGSLNIIQDGAEEGELANVSIEVNKISYCEGGVMEK